MSRVYLVKYDGNNISKFIYDNDLKIGTNVFVETDKGEKYGIIIKCEVEENDNLNKITKIAESIDKEKFEKNKEDAIEALDYAKGLAKELKLNMKLVNACYSYDRTQLLFNFCADDRVDFRDYAKKLALKFHTRIELRQIGARDRSKEVAGIGPCGQKLCCARHLREMQSVSMNMAKNQGLALNPCKINGVCNRLLCCLGYEDEVYSENRKSLPSYNDKVIYNGKEAIVKNVDVLNSLVTLQIDKERIVVDYNDKCKK